MTNKLPLGFILALVAVVFFFGGVLFTNKLDETPKPGSVMYERCNNYCMGVARGGSMTWDEYGFACLCGDLHPKPWAHDWTKKKISEALRAVPDAGKDM